MSATTRVLAAVVAVLAAPVAYGTRAAEPVGPNAAPVPVPINELLTKYQLVGRTGQPLFKFVRLEGVVVEGPQKGYEGGPNLRVQRVAGVATQAHIQLRLLAEFPGKNERLGRRDDDDLEPVERGKTYAFDGYEDASFVGVPLEAYDQAGILVTDQTCDVYLRTSFVPLRMKPIDPIVFGPADFIDRKALLRGTARSREGRGFIDTPAWALLAKADGAWPPSMEGKEAEAYGVVRRGPDGRTFIVEDARARLTKLEDQVGRPVELRGQARSLNGHWWFRYRGQDLYVDGMKALPGWSVDNHFRPMVIRGKLERAPRPDLAQIALVNDPPLKDYYVVAGASWEPIDALLAPERPEQDLDR